VASEVVHDSPSHEGDQRGARRRVVERAKRSRVTLRVEATLDASSSG
jgi:hypothetical protein